MNTKYINPEQVAIITARLTKKHPTHYYLSVSDSQHCVLGYSIHALIELEDEKVYYATDAAGRLRVTKRERLTPTYLSIRKQPYDSAVIIRGGHYDGHYVVRTQGEGWLITSTNPADVKPMRKAYADEVRNYVAFHAQYCYRGTFETITL